MWSVWF